MSTQLLVSDSSVEPIEDSQTIKKNLGGRPKKHPIITTRTRGGLAGGQAPIPIEALMAYHEQGLTNSDIARIVGCTTQNVCNRLAAEGLIAPRAHSDRIRKVRADIFAMKGMQLVSHLTDEKLAKAPVKDLAIAINILHQAERLETGKSTQNISYAQILKEDLGDEERLKVIEAEIISRETECRN